MSSLKEKESRFIKLINQNKALVFKVAAIYTTQPEDREDLIQDIYVQLWKSLDSFKDKSKISTWMYRVSLNTSIHYLKRKTRNITEVYLNEKHNIQAQPEDHFYPEAIQLLLRSIQKLNELDKGITLLYLDGKSHNEISEIIGIKKSNVGTRIQRIKDKLNKLNN